MRFHPPFSAALLACATGLAAQSVPTTINYQGRLTDNTPAQNPLNATVPMSFAIYSVASSGAPLWLEPASGGTNVLVVNGIFNVALGANGVPIPAATFTGATSVRYLEITINPGSPGAEILAPRQLITATGYANLAQNANNATTATSATTAGSATNFSGSLAGNVTGTQGATVVATVGGQTAANVAAGSVLANAATSANTANAIVKRDGTGNFSAGTITAALSGNATSATNFSGSLAGDVTGPQGTTVVGRLQGVAVAAGAPGSGQLLQYNGAQWAAATLPSASSGANPGGIPLALAGHSGGAAWNSPTSGVQLVTLGATSTIIVPVACRPSMQIWSYSGVTTTWSLFTVTPSTVSTTWTPGAAILQCTTAAASGSNCTATSGSTVAAGTVITMTSGAGVVSGGGGFHTAFSCQ